MIENKQTIVNNTSGDCLRACITSILGIPNNPKLPNVDDERWSYKWDVLLRKFGIRLVYDHKKIWKQGYWIATVPSKNFPDGLHAIVMKNTKVAFDPSTKKRYRKGRNMLGTDLVRGGYSFEISDAALLPNLITLQNK